MDENDIVYSIASDLKAYKEWSGSNVLDPRGFISFVKKEEYKELSPFPKPNKDNLDNDYQIIKSKLEPYYFDLIVLMCGIKEKDFHKMTIKNKLLFIEEGYRICVLRKKI